MTIICVCVHCCKYTTSNITEVQNTTTKVQDTAVVQAFAIFNILQIHIVNGIGFQIKYGYAGNGLVW